MQTPLWRVRPLRLQIEAARWLTTPLLITRSSLALTVWKRHGSQPPHLRFPGILTASLSSMTMLALRSRTIGPPRPSMRLLAKVIGVLQLSSWFVLASVATFFKNRECPTRVFRGIWRARARHALPPRCANASTRFLRSWTLSAQSCFMLPDGAALDWTTDECQGIAQSQSSFYGLQGSIAPN